MLIQNLIFDPKMFQNNMLAVIREYKSSSKGFKQLQISWSVWLILVADDAVSATPLCFLGSNSCYYFLTSSLSWLWLDPNAQLLPSWWFRHLAQCWEKSRIVVVTNINTRWPHHCSSQHKNFRPTVTFFNVNIQGYYQHGTPCGGMVGRRDRR